jgi:hypothetical protein
VRHSFAGEAALPIEQILLTEHSEKTRHVLLAIFTRPADSHSRRARILHLSLGTSNRFILSAPLFHNLSLAKHNSSLAKRNLSLAKHNLSLECHNLSLECHNLSLECHYLS